MSTRFPRGSVAAAHGLGGDLHPLAGDAADDAALVGLLAPARFALLG